MDRLTKSAYFIPTNCRWETEQLVSAYIKNVVQFHGVPRTILSDRDTRYFSHFWKMLPQAMGPRCRFTRRQKDKQRGRIKF